MFESDREQIVAELRRKMGGGVGTTAGGSAAGGGVGSGGGGGGVRVGVETLGVTTPSRPVLAVPAPLAEILPQGGLPRGGVVSLIGDGGGSTSLLLALLAAPANTWSALVGMPDVGMLAASELGVDLDRVVLVPDPGPDVLQILSVLADGVDLIAVVPPKVLPPSRLKVLNARLRQSGAVLLVAGRWPGADLVLQSRVQGWVGLGQGHGRLRDRELVVEVSGRGAAGRHSSVAMLLRSSRSGIDIGAMPTPTRRLLEPVIAEVG